MRARFILPFAALVPGTAQAAETALSGVGFIRSHFLGQGDFGGLDILDIIVLVLVAVVLMRVLRNGGFRRDGERPAGSAGAEPPRDEENLEARHARAREAWARLSGGSVPAGAAGPRASSPDTAGSDEREFLAGAKAAFVRIQGAFGKGDLADLSGFATPEAVEWFAKRMVNPPPGAPDIVLLDAEVVGRETSGGMERVRVRYKALMREGQGRAAPREVPALWRFSRRTDDPSSHWALEAVEE
ncbi:hypothetical protein M7784_13670 [Desulfovibrio aminophilus]|nr:TIM44-like domain-containing protein [Desulfovibrio aminophilus]MCM0756281.1 hypothetical protein [Desulfovibrio aminophilus]